MINLVQISDLHIGEVFNHRGDCWIEGFKSQDIKLCQAFDQWMRNDIWGLENVSFEDDIHLVMTGDITANGTFTEFEVANNFLFSEHVLIKDGLPSTVGIHHDTGHYTGIAGNHDHWAGKPWAGTFWKGFSAHIYRHFFQAMPFVSPPICASEIELRLIGVDSCSMFQNAMLNQNPFAVGGFSSSHRQEVEELVDAAARAPLEAGCTHRVAAVLCHHPFSKDDRGLFTAGALRQDCVRWLSSLCAKYGIGVILTGHTHNAWTNLWEESKSSKRIRLVRCPTTLQYPAELDEVKRRPGLWSHQIVRDGDTIKLSSTLCLYCEGSFRPPVTRLPKAGKKFDENRFYRKAWFTDELPIFEI